MSNFTFFKKYISKDENNIYGLTGTLGSKKTQEALKILYQLNLLFIPTFKKYKLQIYDPIIENDLDKYEQTLINKIKEIAFNQGRSVLVIFKYIDNVNYMYNKLLKNNVPSEIIIKYTRNDINDESTFLENEIKPNLIILSTNLSGRGTDIKISQELEKKNGLHVILTFLPYSERIERQAFGRAGRKGENGSGQLILFSQETYDKLIENRKIDEENEFNYLIKVYKKRINLFQELFEEFTEFLNSISRKKNVDEIMLLDIKERWGIFLVENDLAKIEKEYKDENSLIINEKIFTETRNKFDNFMKDLKQKVLNKYEYLNPLLLCKTFNKDKCDIAIMKSPILTLGAYSFRSLYKIDRKLPNHKFEALYDFKTLKKNCNIILNQIKTYELMMNDLNINKNSDLYNQIGQKRKFVNELLEIINHNIDTLEIVTSNSKGMIIDLKPRIISLKGIKFHREYYDDILDYFKDYGMCLYEFFTEEKNKEECTIY